MSDRVVFVGPGRAGLALGEALRRAGAVDALLYYGRSEAPPSHPLFEDSFAAYEAGLGPLPEGTTALFLAVPDDAVLETAELLAARGEAPPGCAALHLSGALTTEVLAPLHARGYAIGSFHPLQSLADPGIGADLIPGSSVALSGDPGALAAGRRLAAELGCPTVTIPAGRRPLYHAAAVTASSHLVALLRIAARMLVEAGVDEGEAWSAALGLGQGALRNAGSLGPISGLTGPVARGDAETLRLHLRAIEDSEMRELYVSLAKLLLGEVTRAGLIDDERSAEVWSALSRR